MGHSAAVWDQKAAIEVTKDWNGIDQVVLRSPRGASARVSLHGGQVVSWKNDRGEELLFTSKAIFKPPKAMRGGIPICFPQLETVDHWNNMDLQETRFGHLMITLHHYTSMIPKANLLLT
uniref:Uncharacterized protein n=1 Tax=Nelumbo nucifera TaxID=4432 RepID=A0A822XFX9_NELNU|nr:TPA_asm: hypothetical protein HUJ06_020590 [Nelumbo nucifera]